jgi:hypothetical protein
MYYSYIDNILEHSVLEMNHTPQKSVIQHIPLFLHHPKKKPIEGNLKLAVRTTR